MDYDIVFLSILIPNELEDEVREKSSGMMEDAAIAYQKHVIEGLEKNTGTNVKLFNILPVHAYPGGYKDAFIKKSKFAHSTGSEDINIGFCNVKIIKRMFRHRAIISEVEKWANTNTGKKKVLIAYTLFHEFTLAIRKIKEKYPDIITVSIVVDLPMLVATSRKKVSLLSKIYENWSAYQSRKNNAFIDGFAVITKQMGEVLSADKPYIVIEGISTDSFPDIKINKNEKIKILYAGLLLEKFGILKLVDAFSMIEDQEFELLICGIGEAEAEISERAGKDRRIKFLGQLKREEVLRTMLECDIIVNPRENVGEFTKYSFPSKNLEALSSGVPFIGYKLDGIPNEYDDFINYPEDNTVEALAQCIVSIGKTDRRTAAKRAEDAKKWVLENKNCYQQGKRLLELIGNLSINQEGRVK